MRPLIIISLVFFASVAAASDVKEADLAGSWYTSSAQGLKDTLQGYLDAAHPEKIDGRIFAIISPHAGYRFSGPVAAYGFKLVENLDIKTVILIGFSHRRPFDGISIYDKGAFRTPLGEIKVNTELASAIKSANGRMMFYPEAFSEENSVEMQIPFIQMSCKDASIVPIAFGTQSFGDAEALADALASALKGRDDYLIVASTDLSHYHPYAKANEIDSHMMTLFNVGKARELYEETRLGVCELCGIMPVTAVLLAADKLGFGQTKVLKYANSGDTYGDKSRVVGYLSAAIYRGGGSEPAAPKHPKDADKIRDTKTGTGKEELPMLNQAQRKRLLQIARESITSYVRDGKVRDFKEADSLLNEQMGAFVTIHERGELRGCIGNMAAQGPLYKTVADMAIQASTEDPRFSPLAPSEIDKIDIEVSVLSPLKKVSGPEEVNVPGHGVVVRRGFRSGVFLPQVATETGWSKEEFLSNLCAHKAGLAPDAWKDPATQIYVFSAEVFGEDTVSQKDGKETQ